MHHQRTRTEYLSSLFLSAATGKYTNAKCAFCVHNIAFQGRFWPASMGELGLPDSASGDFFFEYQDDVYSIDISDGTVTTIDDTFGDPGTNGGDLAAHPDNGTWYFVDGNGKVSSASTDFSTFQNEYEIPTVFAPSGITSYPGATILENGTLLFNQGQKLYATTGDWANGSGGVTQLNDGSTLGGDMATCTTPYSDSDNDGLQDFLEENLSATR